MWSAGDGNEKPIQYCCLENLMNSMKRQKGVTLKDELPRSTGAQYATEEEWRNNSRQNKEEFSSVQSLSRVQLFVTSWTAAYLASLSITNSQSSLKLMSIESVMPANHLILCCPLLLPPSIFPSIRSFRTSQLFELGGQSTGVLASASLLPVNIQDWFPLGLTGWISLQSKGLSRAFSNTIVQKHRFFSTQFSL